MLHTDLSLRCFALTWVIWPLEKSNTSSLSSLRMAMLFWQRLSLVRLAPTISLIKVGQCLGHSCFRICKNKKVLQIWPKMKSPRNEYSTSTSWPHVEKWKMQWLIFTGFNEKSFKKLSSTSLSSVSFSSKTFNLGTIKSECDAPNNFLDDSFYSKAAKSTDNIKLVSASSRNKNLWNIKPKHTTLNEHIHIYFLLHQTLSNKMNNQTSHQLTFYKGLKNIYIKYVQVLQRKKSQKKIQSIYDKFQYICWKVFFIWLTYLHKDHVQLSNVDPFFLYNKQIKNKLHEVI